MNDSPTRHILLVEDNPGDIRLTTEALRESEMNVQLHVAMDGVEGSDYLFQREGYEESVRPDLIMLDLNLPRKSGHELLTEIKNDTNLKSIPVIIFTTSDDGDDVRRCYRNNVNCYIIKPIDFDEFFDVLQMIDRFWFNTVRLPKFK